MVSVSASCCTSILVAASIYNLRQINAFTLTNSALSRNPYITSCPRSRNVMVNSGSSSSNEMENGLTSSQQERRQFLTKTVLSTIMSSLVLVGTETPSVAIASDDDLTSKMFNEDGSLKEGIEGGAKIETEAKSRVVSIQFPASSTSEGAIVSIDGAAVSASDNNSLPIKVEYSIPEKWTAAPDYLDTFSTEDPAQRQKACDRITVFQVPGTFKNYKTLDKATTVGVAKSVGIPTTGEGVFPRALISADIITGRKVSKPVQKSASDGSGEDETRQYYEFDLAVAPDNCGQSAENLGLGFCPYDTIVLLSATIANERMYVCGVTCTKDEWKRANADLKRVRGSFFVEAPTSTA